MTRKEIFRRAKKIKEFTQRYYEREKSSGVQKRLQGRGINVSVGHIENTASDLGVKHRRPETTQLIREVICTEYPQLGGRQTSELLKSAHGIEVSPGSVSHIASDLRVRFVGNPQASATLSQNMGVWSLGLSNDKKAELLTDWRSSPHLPGKSNFDLVEKWRSLGCTSADALRHGIRALGETRNRLEITAAQRTLVWSLETDKMLVDAVIESRPYSPYFEEGRQKIRELKKQTISKLKESGLSRVSEELLKNRLAEISQERLRDLGFEGLQAPLRWGSREGSPQSKAAEKK